MSKTKEQVLLSWLIGIPVSGIFFFVASIIHNPPIRKDPGLLFLCFLGSFIFASLWPGFLIALVVYMIGSAFAQYCRWVDSCCGFPCLGRRSKKEELAQDGDANATPRDGASSSSNGGGDGDLESGKGGEPNAAPPVIRRDSMALPSYPEACAQPK